MRDEAKDERILFLLRVWMRLQNTCWPKVIEWVETKLNEELPE